MKNYIKKWFFSLSQKLKTLSKPDLLFLILASIILYFIFDRMIFFVKTSIVFLKENTVYCLTSLMALISVIVFIYHWKFVGAKTWLWRKIAFLFFLNAFIVDKMFLKQVNLEEVEKIQLEQKYKSYVDSVTHSLKASYQSKELILNSKLEELDILKDSLKFTLSSAKIKKEKIESLNQVYIKNNLVNDSLSGLVAELKKENDLLIKKNQKSSSKKTPKKQTSVKKTEVKYTPPPKKKKWG